jgi:hypothetical protein
VWVRVDPCPDFENHLWKTFNAGRFIGATGFRLSDDGTSAAPIELSDEIAPKKGVIELSLTWKSG